MATTIVIPLNDGSDLGKSPRKSNRTRKSTQVRPPTPNPKSGRKRALEEVENEETPRSGTPKRRRQKRTPEENYAVRQVTVKSTEPRLRLSDLVEADLTPRRAQLSEAIHVTGTDENAVPVTEDLPDSGSRRKPAHPKSPGQRNSISSSQKPVLRKPPRRLLISDFAEPSSEYNSIMEGEDFTMISLSTVPSAQQHLSQRREVNNISSSASNQAQMVSSSTHKSTKSKIGTPVSANQTGAFKSEYAGRRATEATDQGDALRSTPENALQQRIASNAVLHDGANVPAETQAGDLNPEEEAGDGLGFEVDPAFDMKSQSSSPAPVSRLGLRYTNDKAYYEDFHPDLQARLSEGDDNETYEEMYAPDAGLLEDGAAVEQQAAKTSVDLRSSGALLDEESDVGRSHQQAVEPEAEPVLQNKQGGKHPLDLDEYSMMRLPQKRGTPSHVFSSPVLPVMHPMSEKQTRPAMKSSLETPKLTRVVKAGRALQDVVEPYTKQKSPTKKSLVVAQSPRDEGKNLFSGFSVASRRELRAGLRLGEELAKRQSSILDTPMKSAPSPMLSSPQQSHGGSVRASPTAQRPETGRHPATLRHEPPTETKIQLPSPETSSNDTEQRNTFTMPRHAALHQRTSSPIAGPKSTPLRNTTLDSQHLGHDNNIAQVDGSRSDDDDQDTDFHSDAEVEAEDGNEDDQAVYEETDVWQIEAREASPPPARTLDTHTSRTSHFPRIESQHRVTNSKPQRVDFAEEHDVRIVKEGPEIFEFDEEDVAASSVIYTPAKTRHISSSTGTASSPITRPQRDGEDFGDFTNFTQDLIQAANRQPRLAATSKLEYGAAKQRTPVAKITQDHTNPFADAFTTRSFLDTSAASVRSRKSPVRKQISFRPTNRKESWLFDPARLRKPPSPFKPALQPSTPTAKSDVTSFPLANPAQFSEILEDSMEDVESTVARATAKDPVITKDLVPDDIEGSESEQQTPGVRFGDSSPLSIFVAAAEKAEAQKRLKDKARAARAQEYTSDEHHKAQQQAKPPQGPRKVATSTERQHQTKLNPTFGLSDTKANSNAKANLPDTAQSSFVSDAPTDTSVADHETTQTTWLSLLTSIASPLIASTKAISTLATTALQRNRSQTFYPRKLRDTTGPAVFTRHLPFNDTHWTALHALYKLAMRQPGEFHLPSNSLYTEYLDLEIDSNGWKRTLEEWELGVAVQFLRLIDQEGVHDDEEEEEEEEEEAVLIDIESVIKRVFSLWVGMVMRGQVELTDGRAGAWDRRFVRRRDEILWKQKQWLHAHN